MSEPTPYYDIEGNPLTMWQWAHLMERNPDGYKWIARTALPGDIVVSTVWLGINHNWTGVGPPLIFETMIFGGPLNEDQWRWATADEARAGHEAVVTLVQAELELTKPWDG